LTDLDAAPRQGDEGAPDAYLVLDARFAPAMAGLEPGTNVLVLTWLDRADRNTLAVHPRSDPNRPLTGVFATRSSGRPNPVGLHRVTIRAIDGVRILVGTLEAIHGTPIVDIKPVLSGDVTER